MHRKVIPAASVTRHARARSVLALHAFACGCDGVVGLRKQVRVGAEGDGRVGVPELAADEHHVQALGGELRGDLLPRLLPPGGARQSLPLAAIAL